MTIQGAVACKHPSNEERVLLQNLQGDTLKGSGREHATRLLVRLQPAAESPAKAFLREGATDHARDALTPREQAERYSDAGKTRVVSVRLGLSAEGHGSLGREQGDSGAVELLSLNHRSARGTILPGTPLPPNAPQAEGSGPPSQ